MNDSMVTVKREVFDAEIRGGRGGGKHQRQHLAGDLMKEPDEFGEGRGGKEGVKVAECDQTATEHHPTSLCI